MEPDEMSPTSKPRSRGGRPWSFDRDRAVDTAMVLFWRHGYEGVSISDLTAAIGVAAPSLYAAFGSKAGLYREALDRYEASIGRLDADAIRHIGSLPEAIRAILSAAAASAVRDGGERGCMISVGAITCGPDHDAIRRDLAERRERLRSHLAELLNRFTDKQRVEPLSRTLVAIMQGLSMQARDGATLEQLTDIVDVAVKGMAMEADRAG